MSNLLSANFHRLIKNKLFWLGNGLFSLFAFFNVINLYSFKIKIDSRISININFMDYLIPIAFASAIFISLFVGRDYSDGTIRNKIIVGSKRTSIYLSHLITNSLSSIFMCLFYIIVFSILGFCLLGGFNVDIKLVLLAILTSLIIIISLCSIFTLISMNISNKTGSLAVCVLLILVGSFVSSSIKILLEQPKVYEEYSYQDEFGDTITVPAQENINYVSGVKRDIYEFIDTISPASQIMRCRETFSVTKEIKDNAGETTYLQQYKEKVNDNLEAIGYSLATTVIITGIGVFLFRRKNLK